MFYRDNPNVDIVGANLYDRYLKRAQQNRDNGNACEDNHSDHLPLSRSIPKGVSLCEQTVRSMESLLVGTGVFKPEEKNSPDSPKDDVYHGHRDIMHEPELAKPSRFVPDVCHGIQHILKQENFSPCALSS